MLLTTERDHLLVIEAHAAEDVADVLRALRGVGQATLGRARGAAGLVNAAWAPDDLRAWKQPRGLMNE